ncbi:hypothetical protein AMB3_3016 [plant metagenome]
MTPAASWLAVASILMICVALVGVADLWLGGRRPADPPPPSPQASVSRIPLSGWLGGLAFAAGWIGAFWLMDTAGL